MSNWVGNSIGFLGRLRKDVRGNTLALVAAGMLPLLGLIGGGIDMSRIYLAKSRLQQACDAGALAGRKAMGGGSWTQNSSAPNT
ncbi:MAG: pilus assembly protein TadG-related protein, partial [Sphingobium sp.]